MAEDSDRYEKDLLDVYLECRTFGHAWFDGQPNGNGTKRLTNSFFLVCGRCGMTRTDEIGQIGDLVTRSYVPPPDYKVSGQIGITEYRVEILRRRRSQARHSRGARAS